MTTLTPTVRATVKRTAFWSVGTAVAIVVAIVVLVARGATTPNGIFLSATNAAPSGGMAVAEVLRDRGVEVVVADTQDEAEQALADGDATLLLHDAGNLLEPERLRDVSRQASHTVLVEPGFLQLRRAVPQIGAAGAVTGHVESDCTVPAVVRAGTVLGDGLGYRLTERTADAHACLGSGDDVFSLIQVGDGDRTITVLGASAALTNERVAERGNAALALGLLGGHGTLVWYQPTLADVDGGDATIADLTPAWLSAVLALLVLTVIAAGVWRGRRMGPLVVEHLPVTVPSNETMDGRARLYQKASARLRALDALRVGTISRLASACGLPGTAPVSEVAAVTASVTGSSLHEVRWLLLDAEPSTDRDLVRLSDELLTLEKEAVRAATGSPTTEPGE